MKKLSKLISFIFALTIILTIILPNVLKANTLINNVNDSYVSAIAIKETITGLEPFDLDDEPGNDSSANNYIVRSFDSLSYTIEYVTALKNNTPITDAYLMVEFILPCNSSIATFDMNLMTWIEDPVLTEQNGQQILTGKRYLKNTSASTAIPGAGTLSVGIKIQGASNGTTLEPVFKLYMEGNNTSEQKTTTSPTIIISAAPKYNIQVVRNGALDYLSHFDFENNTYSQENLEGSNHGRLQGYSLAISLYNDNSSKGMKGIEIPVGDIEFDLVFKESIATNGGTELTFTNGYTPLLWDYSENNPATTIGKLGRPFYFKNNSNYAAYIAPANKGTDTDSCYDGGSWHIEKTSENTYHVTISNYQFSQDFTFPTRFAGEAATTSREQAHIGYFTTGYIEVLCQFPESVQDVTSLYLDVEAKNLTASTASNQIGGDVMSYDNQSISTITLYPPGSINRTIEFRYAWGGYWLQEPYTSRGDSSLFQGELFTAAANGTHTHDYNIRAYNMLLKFDDKAFEFPEAQDRFWYVNPCWGNGSTGESTFFYAAKPDKTGWTSFEEMRDTHEEDLVFFSSLEELQAQGYICIGYLVEGRDTDLDGGVGTCANMKIKDDAIVNQTYCMQNDFRIWFTNTDFTYANMTLDSTTNKYPIDNDTSYVQGYPEPSMISYTTAKNNYIKTEYDENGNIITGTHFGGYVYGNTILVIGYKTQIQQEIETKDSFGAPKITFDMDANERTITFKLTPKAVSTMTPGQTTTNLYITETLPRDLIYNENTSYYNNQPLEPEVIINDDGTTTLKWTLHNVEVNATLPSITFDCTIGRAGTNDDVENNQIITTNVRISGDKDKREAILANDNYAETSFSVIKLSAISISKITDTPYVSIGQDFNFTLRYANNAENALPNSKIYDILPYNGDTRGSDFHGTYKINSIVISFTNAPKTFIDFINNDYVVGYTTTQNIPTNSFETISAIDNWVAITNKSVDHTNKSVTYTGVSEAATGLIFNMKLEGLEYLEITLNMSPVGSQEENDIYINDFYQYSNGQEERVHSNYVSVQVHGFIQITKIWQDENNKYNTRPSSLDIILYQDGNPYRTITLTANNQAEGNPHKWVQRIDNVPLYDNQGREYVYTIEEDLTTINTNFYFDAIYDQDTLTVTNIGIWVKDTEFTEYMIIVNKNIVNQDNQPATSEDFNKMNLDINDNQSFQIVLKELTRTITNNGTTLSESYSGYSGNEYHGIVTINNQLIFRNIPAGKYEISENVIQYFNFIEIEKIESSTGASFSYEDGKYYVTLSGITKTSENIEVTVINQIENSREYEDSTNKINLFKFDLF